MAVMRRLARARLASQVIRRLRRAGVQKARYDARAFAVRFTAEGDDAPTVMELAGLLADRSGGRRGRRARRERFVAGFLRKPGLPVDWATARPLVRPVLRGVTAMPAGVSAPLRRPVLPFLAEYVVVDQPDTMTYLSADQLVEWEVSADEVFTAACANLTGAVLQGVASEPTVVQFIDDGDAYWTSHLLLDGWLARLGDQVGGVPVAFAPERGTLIVAADRSAHLPSLFSQVETAYATSPRAISPMAYVSGDGGRTVPYAAPDGHPMHGCVQRANAVLAVTEYTRQLTEEQARQAERAGRREGATPGEQREAHAGEPPTADPSERRKRDAGETPTASAGDWREADPGGPPKADAGGRREADAGEPPTASAGERRAADPAGPPTASAGERRKADPAEPPTASAGERREADAAEPPKAGPGQPRQADPGQPLQADAGLQREADADRLREADGGELPEMAELRIVGSAPTGWRTRAIWTRDEPALLPRADEVLLGERVTLWAEVEEHLTEVPGFDPPRWRGQSWS